METISADRQTDGETGRQGDRQAANNKCSRYPRSSRNRKLLQLQTLTVKAFLLFVHQHLTAQFGAVVVAAVL